MSCGNAQMKLYSPYNLAEEDEYYKMPKALTEISGLSGASDSQVLCLEDERGRIYTYNYKKEEIINTTKFVKEGDFEGIAITNSEIYALKSNGTLYRIRHSTDSVKDDVKIKKITTFLNEKYDAEGLCYDSLNNVLLIACKGSAGKGKKYKNKKAIYAFDLLKQELRKEPFLLIDVQEVQKMKRSGGTQRAYDKYISMGENNITFNPSGIAVHPITKDVYIISAVGNTLLITKSDGKILKALHFKNSELKQPEGITFDRSGTMYISNEGHGGRANIKVFYYRPIQKK
jgi:uncharacterized protein YjiK